MRKKYFTSESVTQGHPDKMCDQISDSILDEILKCDPYARVACETLITTGLVVVSGEITTNCYVDIPKTVRKTIEEIGYTRAKFGFDSDTCGIMVSLDEQSSDIAMGVDESYDNKESLGAGDQGIMFGYACDETDEYMPMPIYIAHKLTKRLSDVRKDGIIRELRPDGKSQVTVEYIDGKVNRVDTIVISTQHSDEITQEELREKVKKDVIEYVIDDSLLDENTKILINPTGRFVIGGPLGDTGLTGRKIIVDTYGGMGRHGGGAFSGKDATKVDRSASYAARHAAKNIVAAGLAKKVEIELGYAIGVASPVSIHVDTFRTGIISDERIEFLLNKHFDFSPTGIIERLDLRRPIYKQTASYGHFGRSDLDLSWEKLDYVDILKKEIK